MRPLAALERFFERLFERQTARLFRTKLQPIQLQRRVERAMESERVRDGDRTLVPNRYAIHIAPDDLSALRAAHPSLAPDLADAALGFARGHGYILADRPTVALIADAMVDPGDIRVAASVDEDLGTSASGQDGRTGSSRAGGDNDSRPRADPTAVFVIPVVDAPRATLREIRPDGSSQSFALEGRPLTIGRGSDNGLVLQDSRASRHHARIYGRQGALLLSDLDSTNGSWVNDRRVHEIALGEGDRIRLGDTVLVVESMDQG
jgi:FHA domain-containing protein